MRHAVGMSVPPARLAHYQTVAKVLLAFLESSLDTPALAAPAIRSALDDGPLPREAFRFTAMPRTTDVPTGYEFWRAMAEPRTTLEAIERYRDASARLPGIPLMASGRFDRAGSALLEDHASLAVAVMVLWIEVYPRCVAAHVNLGDARLATGDLAGAKTAYEAALRLDEGAVLAREGLTRSRACVQRGPEAARAPTHRPSAVVLQWRSRRAASVLPSAAPLRTSKAVQAPSAPRLQTLPRRNDRLPCRTPVTQQGNGPWRASLDPDRVVYDELLPGLETGHSPGRTRCD